MKTHIHTHRHTERSSCDHRGRDGGHAAARQGTERVAGNPQRLRGGQEQTLPLRPQEGTSSADTLILHVLSPDL